MIYIKETITIEMNDTPIKQNYKVPRMLWENFKAVLLAQ
jgi:hypothetical protein